MSVQEKYVWLEQQWMPPRAGSPTQEASPPNDEFCPLLIYLFAHKVAKLKANRG